jgi:site-specific DNA-methyltransferase (adenine-specific)
MLTTISAKTVATNSVLHGDCVEVMRSLPSESIDFILTDPPYLVRYRDRHGRTVANDDNSRWLKPSFAEMHRLLKPGSLAVSFYGWNRVDLFFDAWKSAGFQVVGHLVFRKRYASSARFLQYHHESAYLLAKGDVTPPAEPLPDVLDWTYTGNRLHPTQKPVESLRPLIASFCNRDGGKPGGVVLDPFCGSGSTLVAARDVGCAYLGIELDATHHRTAVERLHGIDINASPSGEARESEAGWARPFTRYVEALA